MTHASLELAVLLPHRDRVTATCHHALLGNDFDSTSKLSSAEAQGASDRDRRVVEDAKRP